MVREGSGRVIYAKRGGPHYRSGPVWPQVGACDHEKTHTARPDESVCQSSTEGRDQPPLAIWMRLPLPNAQSEDEGELCTGNHLPMKRRKAHNAGPLPLSPVPPHVNRLTLTCLPRRNIPIISHKRQGGDRLPLRVCKVLWQHIPK